MRQNPTTKRAHGKACSASPLPSDQHPSAWLNGDLRGLDPGIRKAVERLQAEGIETFESCEGGTGHSFPEPTVRFYGTPEAGWRAVGICLAYGLPILFDGAFCTSPMAMNLWAAMGNRIQSALEPSLMHSSQRGLFPVELRMRCCGLICLP